MLDVNVVVGSGPAGVACAHALLARGELVTMVDAGIEMEDGRRAIIEPMRHAGPEAWTAAQLHAIREGFAPLRGQAPMKRAYGSDFTFREVDRFLPMRSAWADVRPSLALGGLSNIWGAAILPYRSRDLADWPVLLADLEPHYRAVATLIPVSATEDHLAREFPIYAGEHSPLGASRQALGLIADLDASRDVLDRDGYRFGRAQLAVRAAASANGPGCASCGLCLYGCPYGLIFNAADTRASLCARPGFTYAGGVVVRSIREEGSRSIVHGVSISDGRATTVEARRVFVAAGVLGTARIVLESAEAYDRPVTLQDSQYFLLPLLRYQRVRDVKRERLHTLAQVFVEIDHASVAAHNVHLQIYGYNDLYDAAVGAHWLPGPIRDAVIDRLLVVQGYLHGRESAPITLTLGRPVNADPPTLLVEAVVRAETVAAVRRVVRSLTAHRRHLRAVPLAPFLQIAPSGRGYHSGGTFPMRRRPGPFETDALGRLDGFDRLHLVDASVLPDIPASPITFTVMANAHRIGSRVPA